MSCDSALQLTVKAAKCPNVSVSVYGNARPVCDSINRAVIRVPTGDEPPKYKQTFFYGLGFWSKDAISLLANRMDSIVVVNRSGTLKLTDSTEIVNYLAPHLSILRNRITIKAE